MDQHPLLHAANVLERVVEQVEHATGLDPAADRVRDAVAHAIPNGPRKDLLSGTWLGHPLHPMLTDLPIGFWTSAFVLDIVGGKQSRPAAELLVGLGVLSALPTAASGAADWSDTSGRSRRVGSRPRGREHLGSRVVRVVVESAPPASARPRRRTRLPRRHRGDSRRISWRPFARTRRGIGVDHTALLPRPVDWTPTVEEASVSTDPRRVDADGVPVLLLRRDEPHPRGGRDLPAPRRAARRGHFRCRDRDVPMARKLLRARGRRARCAARRRCRCLVTKRV